MEDRSPQDRAGIYARWVFGPEPFFGERLCLRIPARRGGPAPWETPREHSRRSPGPEIARESLQPVPPVARSPSISALVPQLGLSYIQSIHLSSWHVSRHCSHVRFTIKAGIMFCYICKVTNAQCTVTIGVLDSFVKASFTTLIHSMRRLDFLHGRGIHMLTISGARHGR